MSDKIRKLLSEMTLEEKSKMSAQHDGYLGRLERLGINGNVPQDNPRGGEDYFRSQRPVEGDGKYHPVAFPSDANMGMTWDEQAAYETGKYFAMECRANPTMVSWLFRPGVNIKRSPLCGRNFEYISEDPVVAGELAGSYIRGLQDNDVAATLKHYLCNHQEFERMSTSSEVSERALREIYLRAFQIAIEKGHPWSVMSSYNRVNGEWVNSNEHLCSMLREDLGYDGVVVSDFAAIHCNKVKAHALGMMDVELAPDNIHDGEILEAMKSGQLPMETMDASLGRLMALCEKLEATTPVSVNMDELHEEARVMAQKSIVMLKNDGILPLNEKQEKLLVIGALAENPSYMGGGSGHMNGYKIDSYLEAVREIVPDADYKEGYDLIQAFPPVEPANYEKIDEAVSAAEKADVTIVLAGLGYCYESEGYDRRNIQLPEGQRILLDRLTQTDTRIVLVLSCASVLDITPWNDKVAAIVYNGLGGEAVGSATVDVLFGFAEPGGRLAETWPVCEEHTPTYMNFAREGKDMNCVVYGEDIYVGYRWYEKRKLPVLYPFGHGLSYTTFEIGQPVLSSRSLTPADRLEITVPVRNTGDRSGSQVVQVYVKHCEASVCDHPIKQLKGFAKVYLEAGEEKDVTIVLDRKAFEFFAPAQNKWLVEDGTYSICIAVSAQDVLYCEKVAVTGGDAPVVYTEMTPLAWFIDNPKYHEILHEDMFEPQVDALMNQDTFEWSCMTRCLPFYKVVEPYLGFPMMSQEQAEYVLKKMNERS